MRIALLVSLLILSGCVVPPDNQRYVVTVTYPQYGGAYSWDSSVRLYYFVSDRNRYYMPPGWNPNHGYPKGKYKKY